ncbi:MAG: HEPN domain-containing protein [Firmicutes bacterium]|nr:HEPN domain-containing protein [Bacillota bacterium]
MGRRRGNGNRDGSYWGQSSPELFAEEWLDNAEQDLNVAEDLFAAGHYGWAAFACQQALEKLLKAAYVRSRHKIPPHVHKLERLFAIMKLNPPEEHINNVLEIDQCYTSTRYPGYKNDLYCRDREGARAILDKARETYGWIKQELQLDKL